MTPPETMVSGYSPDVTIQRLFGEGYFSTLRIPEFSISQIPEFSNSGYSGSVTVLRRVDDMFVAAERAHEKGP